jgi:hypothetical protein
MAKGKSSDEVQAVLEDVEKAGGQEEVTVAQIVGEIGSGAFGPLLLVPALILVSPASGIPGMPTIGSLVISLVAVQMLLGREEVWLPAFVRRRSIARSRMERVLSFLRKPAGVIDRFTRERLVFLTRPPFIVLPALFSSLMVVMAPAFETVPFSVLFALAMLARDGLMALLAVAVFGGVGYLVGSVLL